MKARTLTAFLLMVLIASPMLLAQDDLEIIDPNGKQVRNAKIRLQVDNTEPGAAEVRVEGATGAKIVGDKIIIVDENGNTSEIDISNARGVSVQQSVKTVNENGEQKTVKSSKAIIILPNGERQVIQLDGPNDGEMLIVPDMPQIQMLEGFGDMPKGLRIFTDGLPGSVKASMGNVGKFMIGVYCEKVSDQLRSHLDLSDGLGLIVKSVSPSSPSDEAGIKKHDILLVADDKELISVEILGEVVERVGSEGTDVSLTAIRNGKEISFTLKPVERPAQDNIELNVMPRFQFQRLGPGIIADENFGGELGNMRKQMERMQQQFDQMNQMVDERMQQMMHDRDAEQNAQEDN